MHIKYFQGMWGMTLPTLEANLHAIKDAGFDGVEMKVPIDPAECRRLHQLLDELGLELEAV